MADEASLSIGVPRETFPGERRVALTPNALPALTKVGLRIIVESGAGAEAGFLDEAYRHHGAEIGSRSDAFGADIVMQVRTYPANPDAGKADLDLLRPDQLVIGLANPLANPEGVAELARRKVTFFAMELVPRITRAQSMDALSSQANIGGYKAVILAANEYGRFMPMLMTAAGTVKAARVLVLGAGVAGLQAIATAKRLGAVIEASDVRPAVKEQIESLGAKFLDVPYLTDEEREIAQGVGGYARPMPIDWMRRQAELVHERAKAADIVITTALIPGRPAPVLLREETVRAMKPGSVVVDMAIEQGGNCPLTERDRIVVKHGVKLVGISNLPALVAADASALYARNLLNFLNLLVDPKTGELKLDRSDEIIAGSLVCINGEVVKKGPT